ncbi:hypothetical protein GCM10022198_14830 [Klugiella xanthotipulae]|uniref:DUF7341 domain-containing protein n=1 Tax=Klugiella xanthotipulae TaxID=244735 RepID=A0A543I6P2_9MICO|nr:hypothetical protein [Klugiella xanthotipulae]TQM66225.1 hypothetical protein FB466_1059 [Klugiella xanthotipulae]
MTDLLAAVDALTAPVQVTVTRDDGTTETVEQPPLLTQLHNAIGGGVGTGSSGSAKHERSVIDADALYRFTLIATQVSDWCRIANVVPTRNPTVDLRAWYTAYQAMRTSDAPATFAVRQLREWRAQILDKLEPARMQDLPYPCPACKATSWWNPSTGSEYQRPLVLSYRVDGGERDIGAHCRACDATWNARELAWELEARATLLADQVQRLMTPS